MSDPDVRLVAALQADAPPERDAVFRIDVLVRLERARFRRRVAKAVIVAAVLAVLAAAKAPAIGAWIAGDVQHVWIVAVAAAVALFVLASVLAEAPTGFRTVARAVDRWLYP